VRRTVPPAGLILVAALLAASFAARPAMAADGTLNAFAPEDLYIGVQHPDGRNLGDAEVRRFFNRANCDCSEPVTLYFTFNEGGVAKLDTLSRNGQLQIWIGTACDDVNQRQNRCLLAGSQPLARLIDDGHVAYLTDARVLST